MLETFLLHVALTTLEREPPIGCPDFLRAAHETQNPKQFRVLKTSLSFDFFSSTSTGEITCGVTLFKPMRWQ